MNINKYKLYSFSEIYQLVKHSFGTRLVNSAPVGLLSTHHRIEGLVSKGIKIVKSKNNIVFEYPINNFPFIITLCKNSSDMLVFEQIIVNKEYQVIIDFFNKNNMHPSTIIDAGANIGLTSLFIKAYFPNAKIISLEPSNKTFRRLNINFKSNQLENVFALKKGLWGYKTTLSPDISFRDGLDWAFRLIENTTNRNENSIDVVSVIDIINQYNLEVIDFLKIDIEGGEISVFNTKTDLDWLKKVKVIALEIHDEFNCREGIENTLVNYGFILSNSGELTIGVNKAFFPQDDIEQID